uniref:UBX domain-containing protein n=1 Tax=Schistocephalus solidus TaxID=70667 RepID=A0A183SQP7_SCHSO
LAICRRLRLHSVPPSRPFLASSKRTGSFDATITEGDEFLHLESNVTITDAEDSGRSRVDQREDLKLPIFFNGPLTSALKLVERGTGCPPLLIYLHDDDGVGTPHFVANVLCSRRFNNRLYDANVAVWPLDLTGVMRPQRTPQSTKRTTAKNAPSVTALPVPASRRTGQKQLPPPPPPQPRTRNTPAPSAVNACPTQSRASRRSLSACVTPRDRVREQHSVPPPPSAEANRLIKPRPFRRYFWQPPLPSMAEHLLMMFAQHPAGATFNVIVSKKMLPTLLSLRLEKEKFSVDAILYPNTTTKQGVTWLSRAIRRFQRSCLQPPPINKVQVMEQSKD